ncbi:MAG: lipoyl domain-containing protein [Lachnospiraceae bacterium]|nr:lipoyl domain-containing protein [Lachnospiraceae bacterium]
MKQVITMPQLSDDMKTGILAAWNKKKGDVVKKGDVLYELESSKVVSEIESDVDGILTDIYYEEGDEVEINQPVAVISSNE